MKKKFFKLRRKSDGKFWSGYQHSFSASGAEYVNLERMGSAISRAKNNRYLPNMVQLDWDKECEIVEFHIESIEKTNSTKVEDIYNFSALYEKLRSEHGYGFADRYIKLLKKEDDAFTYKFCLCLPYDYPYAEFVASIKGMGYHTRSYKKTYRYLWLTDENLVTCIKLLGEYETMIDLTEYTDKLLQAIKNIKGDLDLSEAITPDGNEEN